LIGIARKYPEKAAYGIKRAAARQRSAAQSEDGRARIDN
jgi:hypothetical protein